MINFYHDKKDVDWTHHPTYKDKVLSKKFIVKYVSDLPQQRLVSISHPTISASFTRCIHVYNERYYEYRVRNLAVSTKKVATLGNYAKEKGRNSSRKGGLSKAKMLKGDGSYTSILGSNATSSTGIKFCPVPIKPQCKKLIWPNVVQTTVKPMYYDTTKKIPFLFYRSIKKLKRYRSYSIGVSSKKIKNKNSSFCEKKTDKRCLCAKKIPVKMHVEESKSRRTHKESKTEDDKPTNVEKNGSNDKQL
ncbi:hypothetical protein RND71_025141 [Anisodus tanguticus]|uniref:Uncharacterized protein n=1 Tax=Anisodus tanguticus TaxID=243964 RepID=A0AAE1VD60_9SOLA|nr:hypothetical protein RND71_025141 [Anisodus tanguticus]